MEIDLRDIERRPFSYWVADGIPELIAGGIMFVSGLLWLIGMSLQRHPAIWIPFWILLAVGLTALSLSQWRFVRWLKGRISDPRTGHVELMGPSRSARGVGLGITLLLGVSVLYSVSTGKGLATLPIDPILGYGAPTFLGLIFLLLGFRNRRYLILAGTCFACTFIGYLRGLELVTFLWTLVAVGLVTGMMGTLRLRRYLLSHPHGGTPA